jgi:hypothetical protein
VPKPKTDLAASVMRILDIVTHESSQPISIHARLMDNLLAGRRQL